MNRGCKKSQGMTLVELILAVILLNVVILTGISIELGVRRLFVSSDLEIQLLNEAGPILTMATKAVNRGIGSPMDLYYSTIAIGGHPTQRIRIDSNANFIADGNDLWVAFRFHDTNSAGSQYQLWYYPNDQSPGTFYVLSDKVVNFDISVPSDGVSTITLVLRLDPALPAEAMTNPEITIQTRAQYRSVTY
jgi:hypothetical protein